MRSRGSGGVQLGKSCRHSWDRRVFVTAGGRDELSDECVGFTHFIHPRAAGTILFSVGDVVDERDAFKLSAFAAGFALMGGNGLCRGIYGGSFIRGRVVLKTFHARLQGGNEGHVLFARPEGESTQNQILLIGGCVILREFLVSLAKGFNAFGDVCGWGPHDMGNLRDTH